MSKAKPTTTSKEIGKPKYKRGEHPNSKKNLEMGMAKPGDKLNPNGRPLGSPDRATVIRQFMDHEITINDPADPKHKTLTVTLYQAGAFGQFRAAMGGSTQAWKEIQDALWGKMPDKTELELGGSVEQSITFKRAKDVNSTDEDN